VGFGQFAEDNEAEVTTGPGEATSGNEITTGNIEDSTVAF